MGVCRHSLGLSVFEVFSKRTVRPALMRVVSGKKESHEISQDEDEDATGLRSSEASELCP